MSYENFVVSLGPVLHAPMDNIDFEGRTEEIVNFVKSDITTANLVDAGGAVGSEESLDVEGHGPIVFPVATTGTLAYAFLVRPVREAAQNVLSTNDDNIAVNGYAGTILADGPVGYWRLGEASGATTAVDETGNGHDGTYVGGPTLGVSGAVVNDDNTAVDFLQGANTTVEIPDSPSLNPTAALSIEAWVYWPDAPDNNYPFIAAKGHHEQYELFAGESSDFRPWARVMPTGGSTYTSLHRTRVPIQPTATWVHVAWTYDAAGDSRLYLDGALVHEEAAPGELVTTGWGLRIGNSRNTSNYPFHGSLDEPAFYDRALTAEEVEEHYNIGINSSVYANIGTEQSPLIDTSRWNLVVLNNGLWTVEPLNEEDVEGLLIQNTSLFDRELTATEVDDLISMAEKSMIVRSVDDSSVTTLSDDGATGIAANWQTIGV